MTKSCYNRIMKNFMIFVFAICLLNANYALADDMCSKLRTEKEQALVKHEQWAKTIFYDDKHDGTVSPGEMLVNLDLLEIQNHYSYLLSVYGCYK